MKREMALRSEQELGLPDAGERWERVRARLRDEVGEKTFERCLKSLVLVSASADRIVLATSTRFMGNYVNAHFGERLLRLWKAESEDMVAIEVAVLEPKPVRAQANGVLHEPGQYPDAARVGRDSAPLPPRRLALDSALPPPPGGLDRNFTFESFVVGKSNALAHAAARRVAEAKVPVYNPLYIYGASGLGKTHLMHAIGNEILRRDGGRRVLYLSAESFLYQFVSAVRFKDTLAFKEAFRNVDVLMVDDLQFMARKEATQEEFFHTFNALVENRRQIVVSADCSPHDLKDIEERIRSRLGCGMTVDIQQTDYELRLGILEAKCERLLAQNGRNIPPIPREVMEFVAERITSNVRDLEGALTRIIAQAELVGGTITVETTRHVLRDLLRASERQVTIHEIQQTVAETYGFRVSDLKSERRAQPLVNARHVGMWLAKELTQASYPLIGREFQRDHTSVMHAVRKVERLRAKDSQFVAEVDGLVKRLRG
jgi:chromosomal replication initiator protein